MSKFLHGLGHLGIIALTFIATYYGFVPGKYAPLAVAAGGLAQAALAMVNHPTPAAPAPSVATGK